VYPLPCGIYLCSAFVWIELGLLDLRPPRAPLYFTHTSSVLPRAFCIVSALFDRFRPVYTDFRAYIPLITFATLVSPTAFAILGLYTMAENAPAATPSSLPSIPQSAAGAQNQQYDGAQGNGQTNPSHMPPPPRPPVIIPQNTNPIPTAMTSPMSGGMMSPTSAGGYVRRAAPEPNKRALYVGGLDPRVTEDILKQIFETTGHVLSVKIIPDKNVSCIGRGNYLPLF